jgi:hypothetical protein
MIIFIFKVSGEVMAKFCQIPDLCRKVCSAQNSYSVTPVEFLTVVTHKSPTVWRHFMDHRKAERVTYRNGIQSFRSFSQSEAQKFSSIHQLFYPEIEFSSEVNVQNSLLNYLLDEA